MNIQHLTAQFSALDFYPSHDGGPSFASFSVRLNSEIEEVDTSHNSEDNTETEEEWYDEPQLAELAWKFGSRMADMMAIEVCL